MSKTARGAKLKGKCYERHIAETIKEVFGGSARRTPCSGAIQEVFPGDIMSLPPELSWFTIECKKQERLEIWSFLRQASREAESANKIPLLVFSRNREKDYVALEWTDFLAILAWLKAKTDSR